VKGRSQLAGRRRAAFAPTFVVALATVLAATPAAGQSPSPSALASSEAQPSIETAEPLARVIELVADPGLRWLQDGEQVSDIAVRPGETVIFRVVNSALFAHDFYIGSDEELSAPGGTTEVGIPSFGRGVRELEWTVPEELAGLKFGCTLPGHYPSMQGTFSLAAPASPAPASPAPSPSPAPGSSA